MGGQDFVIPPLTMAQRIRLEPELKITRENPVNELVVIEAICRIVLAAVQRNYPDVTLEQMLDVLDMGNIGFAFTAAMVGPMAGGTPDASRTGAPKPSLRVVTDKN
jgi:hypothetical protein